MSTPGNTMALDVGERRIGVAFAHHAAKIAYPLTTITNDDQTMDTLRDLMREHDVATLVVGLPRSLGGEETAQTAYVCKFAEGLKSNFPHVAIYMQDEAATSVVAEQRLKQRKSYTKEDIDSMAASIILEDFLQGGV